MFHCRTGDLARSFLYSENALGQVWCVVGLAGFRWSLVLTEIVDRTPAGIGGTVALAQMVFLWAGTEGKGIIWTTDYILAPSTVEVDFNTKNFSMMTTAQMTPRTTTQMLTVIVIS
jgi:hypothetical protein